MWPGNLTRQKYLDFLVENARVVLDELLTPYAYTINGIVMDELTDELEDYRQAECYWEAC